MFYIYYHANLDILNMTEYLECFDYTVAPYVCVATHSVMDLILRKKRPHINKSRGRFMRCSS